MEKNDQEIEEILAKLKADSQSELHSILDFWIENTIDHRNRGFVGQISAEHEINYKAEKGSVLNFRILWTFSAAYNFTKKQEYLSVATRSFDYICRYFIDNTFEGSYWTLDFRGRPSDTKKQVYSIAFCIYALSEYHIATGNESSKQLALRLYKTLLEKAFDKSNTGYFEAFQRDWSEISDLRLSEKDANEKKSMNTHLHVLEAYTNLFRIWPDQGLKLQIESLLENFARNIIDKESYHLHLFFGEDWQPRSETISYGHDIEASWLLLEAAEALGDDKLISRFKTIAIEMAKASLEGLNPDGSLSYEYEPKENSITTDRHWWVQAEAAVGFFNAWQISGQEVFLRRSVATWNYIQSELVDRKNGEWFWGKKEDGSVMPDEDKVGLWKCPYHNSRACIELARRSANFCAL